MGHAYTAEVEWQRGEATFTDRRYSRAHRWRFDGGIEVPASSSPLHVRVPYSQAAAVDPEEAFVAALSSCHLLFFLDFAARAGVRVDRYLDRAVGVMGKNAEGRDAILTVTLRPEVRCSGEPPPDRARLVALHHAAHEACYLANSVRSEVRCEPVFA